MPKPIPQHTYTLRELLQLDLLDSPALLFWHGNVRCVVQNCHLTEEELLSVPGMADTTWTYSRTTHEWIPIFVCKHVDALIACVDIEPSKDRFDPKGHWVTPKGFPRAQYEHA